MIGAAIGRFAPGTQTKLPAVAAPPISDDAASLEQQADGAAVDGRAVVGADDATAERAETAAAYSRWEELEARA